MSFRVLAFACVMACGSSDAPRAQPPVATASATESPSATTSASNTWLTPPPPPDAGTCTGDCTFVSGMLPAAAIKRIIVINHARFRGCYAKGVQKTPTLAGRVTMRFTIARDGSVQNASVDPSSTLVDADVHTCLIDAFSKLSFPQPEGGTVLVGYPLIFTPEKN